MAEHNPYDPPYFGVKLFVVATLGWIAAWLFFHWMFMVWLLMVAFYGAALMTTSLVRAVAPQATGRLDVWLGSFFRTAGWLVLSGFASTILCVLGYLVYLRINGHDLFPQ